MGGVVKSMPHLNKPVTATAHDGYKFVNWTKEGVEVSIETEYTFSP